MTRRARSLSGRLAWRLLAAQGVALAIATVVLMALTVKADAGGVLVDDRAVGIVADALRRDPYGQLRLEETEALAALRRKRPDFWFVVQDAGGQVLRRGPMPAAYGHLASRLDGVAFADVRGAEGEGRLTAVARRTTSPVGPVTVLTAGALYGQVFIVLFLANTVAIPAILVIGLLAGVATPLIVRRSLAGLRRASDQAASIDIDSRGERLPEDDVPREIQPLVRAVNGALERLDDGYERQKRFLLAAAHELRTPVAILQTRLEGLDHPARTRLVADVGRVGMLAEQLLDLQRVEQVVAGPVDLTAMARDVVADLAPLAVASGHDLSVAAPGPVWAQGDVGALERVLINLIRNALEHSRNGGEIRVEVGADGRIDVSDDGPGIPASERERIFEPFHKGRLATQGAGLGLSLVREIVDRHGGETWAAESRPGGARVGFRIPLAAPG